MEVAQQRSIFLKIDDKTVELEMDINKTLSEIEEFIKGPDFKAEASSYGIKTIFNARDDLQFHFGNPEAKPSLKHLSLKQFHPKKKLDFYIVKKAVNSNNVEVVPPEVGPPALQPPQ
mgnify:CR=1 FL=1